MKIKVKKLNPNAKIPEYAHEGDAGFDLFTVEPFELGPGERKSIPLGIAMEIPHGYVGLIWDKSGLSHKYGIKSFGGVIDSGYRGEVHAGVMNLGDTYFKFEKGQKIAQMLIQKVDTADFVEVKELSDSERGKGGFGSSGK